MRRVLLDKARKLNHRRVSVDERPTTALPKRIQGKSTLLEPQGRQSHVAEINAPFR